MSLRSTERQLGSSCGNTERQLGSSYRNTERQLGFSSTNKEREVSLSLSESERGLDDSREEELITRAGARGSQRGWYRRFLPHRDEGGLVQFITYRLADSLPAALLAQLSVELATVPPDRVEVERRRRMEDWPWSSARVAQEVYT